MLCGLKSGMGSETIRNSVTCETSFVLSDFTANIAMNYRITPLTLNNIINPKRWVIPSDLEPSGQKFIQPTKM